jgi:hypothetical protein
MRRGGLVWEDSDGMLALRVVDSIFIFEIGVAKILRRIKYCFYEAGIGKDNLSGR